MFGILLFYVLTLPTICRTAGSRLNTLGNFQETSMRKQQCVVEVPRLGAMPIEDPSASSMVQATPALSTEGTDLLLSAINIALSVVFLLRSSLPRWPLLARSLLVLKPSPLMGMAYQHKMTRKG